MMLARRKKKNMNKQGYDSDEEAHSMESLDNMITGVRWVHWITY